MTESRFKYISRKDLDSYIPSQRRGFFGSVAKGIDHFFFSKPLQSFGLVIMLIALPIAVFLTLRSEKLFLRSEAQGGTITLSTSDIKSLPANVIYSQTFEVKTYNTGIPDLVSIVSPSWFASGNIAKGGTSDRGYGVVTFTGTPSYDTKDRFILLASAQKSDTSVCNGCDKDTNLYGLTEFNLTTAKCEGAKVWGRNPIGRESDAGVSGACESFTQSCLAPDSWKQFQTLESCVQSDNAPTFTKTIEDQVYTFETDCEGNFKQDEFTFNESVNAKDSDGDIVRFAALTATDFVTINQDSVETIVKVVAQKNLAYENYDYQAQVKGDVTADLIGSSYPVYLSACDLHSKCSTSTFEISAVKRSICSREQQAVAGLTVDISKPASGLEFKGIDNVVWSITGGTGEYYVQVDLYGANDTACTDFIEHIATFGKLTIPGGGYSASFDSTKHSDGKYCVEVFVGGGPNLWDASDSNLFSIRNINASPVITSTPPKTQLTTGEEFSYTVTATDPNNDPLSFDCVGLPDWLHFENNVISGSTVIPGSYTIAIFVDDAHGGYATQMVTLNVNPPANQPASIEFIYPVKDSVLSGSSNSIKWQASDGDGIAEIKLYYSADAKNWTLISPLPGSTMETNWDVSILTNGEYYLRLTIKDQSDLAVESSKVSERFYISNPVSLPEPPADTSLPAIKNLTPTPESETTSKKPLISASFTPSNGATIILEGISISLDDSDITKSCEVSLQDSKCTLDSELELGRHKAKVSVKDTKEKQMTEEWYFIIREEQIETVPAQKSEETAASDYFTIPLLQIKIQRSIIGTVSALCCAALLLVLIPWLIYFLWSKRGAKVNEATAPTSPVQESSLTRDTSGSEFYYPSAYPVSSEPQPVQPVVPEQPAPEVPPDTTINEGAQVYSGPTSGFQSSPVEQSPTTQPLPVANDLPQDQYPPVNTNATPVPIPPQAPTVAPPPANVEPSEPKSEMPQPLSDTPPTTPVGPNEPRPQMP